MDVARCLQVSRRKRTWGVFDECLKDISSLFRLPVSLDFVSSRLFCPVWRVCQILAFPCRQFASQEFKSNEETLSFCERTKIPFPVFETSDVNGPHTNPAFLYCKWNSDQVGSASQSELCILSLSLAEEKKTSSVCTLRFSGSAFSSSSFIQSER